MDLESLLTSIQRECHAEATQYLAVRVAVAHLYILAFGHLAIGIHPKRSNAGPFSATWISSDGRPDPNLILSQGLVQLVNNALAVVHLSRDGLDVQARALVRMTEELTWQLAVLFSDPELLRKYTAAQSEEEENGVWWELFGRGRLLRRMQDLDKALGLPADVSASLDAHRRGHQRYYSSSVHSSFIAVGIGSYSRSFEQRHFRWALFGAVGKGGEGTLGGLIEALYLASVFLPLVLRRFGNIETLRTRGEWKDFQGLAETAFALRKEIYRRKRGASHKQMQRATLEPRR